MRKTVFANEEFYHIYNRGVDKRIVFEDEEDYKRFLLSIRLQNSANNGLMHMWKDDMRNKVQPRVNPRLNLEVKDKLVDIIAYCLNPNHYHMILKQKTEKGIEKFMQKLGTSYTMYFNKKHKRTGALFQGRFKSAHIDSNEYLLYLSAYINQNHFIHGYEGEWRYASMLDYSGKRDGALCNKGIILDQFENCHHYEEFVNEHAFSLREKKEMQKYIIE